MSENLLIPNERQTFIHNKGFDMLGKSNSITDYNKIKIGTKMVEDVTLNLGKEFNVLNPMRRQLFSKRGILKALGENNYAALRAISEYYYKTSGIYHRACNYFAQLYRYDWYIIPEVFDEDFKDNKMQKDYKRILAYLDNSFIKKTCSDIALQVVKNGCYYGCLIEGDEGVMIQELPYKYCRSRMVHNGMPIVEMNMAFFDETFHDLAYRTKIVKMFPEDIQKGYELFRKHKLSEEYRGDGYGWYILDSDIAFKFSLNNSDVPFLVNAIPSIIDLTEAQELSRKKAMQQLLKILVQKLPVDKNGDLIFDVDEARDIHNTAVDMLSRAIGVDILTTFADIEAIDLADDAVNDSTKNLEMMERQAFNAMGISRNLFNTDGNLSLEKSILDDESYARNLLYQFGMLYNKIVSKQNANKKKYNFRFFMLETTQYNYKEIAKLYKEQVTLGYSKMLPQIALGQSQSAVLSTIYFENEVLDMSSYMIPPLQSSTLNGEDVMGRKGQNSGSKTQTSTGASSGSGEVGRPEKSNDEKSEKTIKNIESSS